MSPCGAELHRQPFPWDCGRDVHYWTPPAQIRTCGFPAYGSHLGCLTAKRSLSDLPYVAQRLGHAFPVLCPARAVLTRIPLGPRHWDRSRARLALGEGFPFLLFRLQDGFTVPPWLTFPEAPL